MLDDRDVAPWAEQEPLTAFNQDTRDSIRGANNYQPVGFVQDSYWPTKPPCDPNLEAMLYEDASDYS